MDYKNLTTEELTACIQAATQERDRRQRLEQIPRQMQILTDTYIADGGDPQGLNTTVS